MAEADNVLNVPSAAVRTVGGTVTVTVPRGTFQAKRWQSKFRLGEYEQDQTTDSVGLTDLRVEAREYTSGTPTATTLRELLTGPVP